MGGQTQGQSTDTGTGESSAAPGRMAGGRSQFVEVRRDLKLHLDITGEPLRVVSRVSEWFRPRVER